MYPEPTKQKGFTLIEILVTALILGVGLLGLAVLQVRAMKGSVDSGQRSKAVWMAQELAERIHANPSAIATYQDSAIKNKAVPTKYCSDYFDQSSGGAKKPTTASCTSTELANFDIWELMQGYTNTTDTKSNLKDFLIAPALSISCLPSPCVPASDVTIELKWQGRNSNDKKTATTTLKTTLTIRP